VIGDLHFARLAAGRYGDTTMSEMFGYGFKLIGDYPTAREVWLYENVVYKINGHMFPDANESEFRNYLDWKDCLPAPFAFPSMHLFEFKEGTVLAAEYIDGRDSDARDKDTLMRFEALTDLFDCWDDNVKIKSGRYYIVDIEA
jgi:hypothetical protein